MNGYKTALTFDAWDGFSLLPRNLYVAPDGESLQPPGSSQPAFPFQRARRSAVCSSQYRRLIVFPLTNCNASAPQARDICDGVGSCLTAPHSRCRRITAATPAGRRAMIVLSPMLSCLMSVRAPLLLYWSRGAQRWSCPLGLFCRCE